MKRKIVYLIIMVLVLPCMVFMLTGCQNKKGDIQIKEVKKVEGEENEQFEKKEGVSLGDAINEYTKNEERLDGKTIKHYCNPQTFEILDTECEGIISIVVQDFDNDRDKECIVIRVKDNTGVEAVMYKEKGNVVKEVSSIVISNDILKYGDTMNLDIFTKKINGETKIFVEALDSSSLLADGSSWLFMVLKVDKDELIIQTKESTAGSRFTNNEIDEYITIVKENGLLASSISLEYTGKSLVEQNEDIVRICNISKKQVENMDITDILESVESKFNYAETTFKDYVE